MEKKIKAALKSFFTYLGIGALSAIVGFGLLILNNIPMSEITSKGVAGLITVIAIPLVFGFFPLLINAGILTYREHKDRF